MQQGPAIIEAEIGKRIGQFRRDRGITLERLAEMTGFSKGYLSKVEKSGKAPPVSTLGNIARALNVTISAVLGEERHRTSFCLVRKDERPRVAGDGSDFGYAYEAMAYEYPNRMMELFMLTLPIEPRNKTLYRHGGEEILFVMRGKMKFTHGGEEYTAEEGDCLYFDASVPHFGESISPEAATCLMVMCNPPA